jgi:hypothetical protein
MLIRLQNCKTNNRTEEAISLLTFWRLKFVYIICEDISRRTQCFSFRKTSQFITYSKIIILYSWDRASLHMHFLYMTNEMHLTATTTYQLPPPSLESTHKQQIYTYARSQEATLTNHLPKRHTGTSVTRGYYSSMNTGPVEYRPMWKRSRSPTVIFNCVCIL